MLGGNSLSGLEIEGLDAPIDEGGASPLRVATGGNANWSSEFVAAARPPSPIDGATTSALLRKPRVLGPARFTRKRRQAESYFAPPSSLILFPHQQDA